MGNIMEFRIKEKKKLSTLTSLILRNSLGKLIQGGLWRIPNGLLSDSILSTFTFQAPPLCHSYDFHMHKLHHFNFHSFNAFCNLFCVLLFLVHLDC
jgi:hypothetical protein